MTSESPGPQQVVYVKQAGNGLAVAALVLGLVGTLLGLVPILFFLAWGTGVTGITLGAIARRRAKREPVVGHKTMATWGIALSILAFILGCVGLGIIGNAFSSVSDQINHLNNCVQRAQTPAQMSACH